MNDSMTCCINYINTSIIILVLNISNCSDYQLTKSINDLIYSNNICNNNDTLITNNDTIEGGEGNNDTNEIHKYYEFFIVMLALCIIGLMILLYIICFYIYFRISKPKWCCNITNKILPKTSYISP